MPSAAATRSSEMHDEDVDYGNDDDNHDMNDEDRELEAMKARVREMEAEAAKLQEMQAAVRAEKEMLARQQGGSSNNASASSTGNGEQQNGEGQDGQAGPSTPGSASAHANVTDEEKEAIDGRSIYVGNVDYGATPEEIQAHFASCGTINRVTILCDKFTGHPKGYAYVEFAEPGLVANSMTLNESLFRGRLIKVTPKRTNVPSFMLGRGRGGRGRPYRGGRGAPRGGYTPYGYPPRGRGRGRGASYQ